MLKFISNLDLRLHVYQNGHLSMLRILRKNGGGMDDDPHHHDDDDDNDDDDLERKTGEWVLEYDYESILLPGQENIIC